jgi:Flp pilus assembly protein TadG
MVKNRRVGKNRRGAITVLAALLMVLLVAMVAYAFDFGNICRVKTETQAVADAAALAGSRGLSVSPTQVRTAAIAAAHLNKANNSSVVLQNSDVVLGTWNANSRTFTALSGSAESQANACQVNVSLTAAGNNPVNTLFAGILGKNTVDVSSSSIAARGGRTDVVIVCDRSSSFSGDISQAIAGMQLILDELNDDAPTSYLGVVTFNGIAYTNASLQAVGTNYNTLKTAISGIQDCSVGGPPCSGSDLAAGMAAGISLFSASGYSPPAGTRKVIFFISDGAANIGSKCLNKNLTDTQDNALAATEAANAWNNNGIAVNSLLYYGSGDTSTDDAAMQALAQGFGTYIKEPNSAQLSTDLESQLLNGMAMQLVH